MTTYQITYETEDGSVEGFMTETDKGRAEKIAKQSAASSSLNEPLAVTRWFVEANDRTLSAYAVA